MKRGIANTLTLMEECPYFKKHRQRKYVEKDTECDKCEFLEQCKDDGYVINCTFSGCDREHYIRGLGSNCRKMNL